MDNLVSVPLTNPCTFLKQQASLDKVAQPTIPDGHRQVRRDGDDALIKTIKSPDANPPVKPKRPPKPSVARKLAQQWLEF